MKLTILSLALLVACASAASIFDATLDSHWTNFKTVHGKNYGNKETMRRIIWESNLKFINQHNAEAEAGVHTFTVGMNKYGDMTSEEFGAMYNGYNMTNAMNKRRGTPYKMSAVKAPESVDWREQGYVTPVKDQGQCGSCWSFSAVASLEGQHFKKTGKLVSLSEQNLVDCSTKYGNMGCNGGLMDQAFSYIKDNKGIDTEESYPYKAKDGKCAFKAADVGATDTGFVDIAAGNEEELTNALATVGPISVAIDASHSSFQLYKKGIYNERRCSSSRLDHGVTAVGYGSNADGDFYIVKNSWVSSKIMQSTAVVALALLESVSAFQAPAAAMRSVSRASATMFSEGDLGVLPPLGVFDPLGLIETRDMRRYEIMEIKHGRAAMLGFLHVIAIEAGIRVPGYLSTSQNLKFSDVPAGCFASLEAVPTAGWLQIMVLTCMQEAGTGFASKPQTDDAEAGDIALDSWVRYDDPEVKAFKLNAERQNGRAAMMGITGCLIHELLGVDALYPTGGLGGAAPPAIF